MGGGGEKTGMRRGTYLVVALLVAVCVIGGGTLAAQVITKPASAAKQASWAPHLYKTANGYPKGNGSGHVSKAGLPPNPHAADLTYFGGPVELQPTAYIVFWGPGWGTQASPSMDAQVIQSFWQNAGHSQYDNLLSQYHDAAGHYISNSLTLGGKFWDPSPPPTSTTTACGAVNAVTDASIEAEVTTLIGNGTFPADHNNATYFVYTPNGDAVNAGSACSGTQFCAYHSYTGNQVGNGYA